MKLQKFHNEMHFISFFNRQLVQIETNSFPKKLLISEKKQHYSMQVMRTVQ